MCNIEKSMINMAIEKSRINRPNTHAHTHNEIDKTSYYSECALDDTLKSDDFSLVTLRWETTKMTAPKSLFWPS